MIERSFWKNRRVFVSGHTGFKGTWLCLWLSSMGAKVFGYALEPESSPSLFALSNLEERIESSIIADIRNFSTLKEALQSACPSVVFHLAAQSLVRKSYQSPVETYETNVLGSVNLLEALRSCDTARAVINVTSDKCYENREWCWGYREDDKLGGYDPYSSSKACAEIVTAAYRNSFFHPDTYASHKLAIASARAGNVIGGGDWSKDRLLPDCIRSFLNGEPLLIRNPLATRPWQHVIEPLSGYILLAEKLYADGLRYSGPWNFGPLDESVQSVAWVVEKLCIEWGQGSRYEIDQRSNPHEAANLKLDCSKAHTLLKWTPRWSIQTALKKTVEFAKAYRNGTNLGELCLSQISEYDSTRFDSLQAFPQSESATGLIN